MTKASVSLPDPDGRFSKLMLDHFAPRHLFVVEGEGAPCVLSLLTPAPDMSGRKSICYVDTLKHRSLGYAENLRHLSFDEFVVCESTLDLLRTLPVRLGELSPPFRIYVAARAWLIEAVVELAVRAGVSQDRVLIECCEPSPRKATCLLCQTEFHSDGGQQLVMCSGCGTALRDTDYYCAQRDVHLAVPASWMPCVGIKGVKVQGTSL
jgi:hypothetical protein